MKGVNSDLYREISDRIEEKPSIEQAQLSRKSRYFQRRSRPNSGSKKNTKNTSLSTRTTSESSDDEMPTPLPKIRRKTQEPDRKIIRIVLSDSEEEKPCSSQESDSDSDIEFLEEVKAVEKYTIKFRADPLAGRLPKWYHTRKAQRAAEEVIIAEKRAVRRKTEEEEAEKEAELERKEEEEARIERRRERDRLRLQRKRMEAKEAKKRDSEKDSEGLTMPETDSEGSTSSDRDSEGSTTLESPEKASEGLTASETSEKSPESMKSSKMASEASTTSKKVKKTPEGTEKKRRVKKTSNSGESSEEPVKKKPRRAPILKITDPSLDPSIISLETPDLIPWAKRKAPKRREEIEVTSNTMPTPLPSIPTSPNSENQNLMELEILENDEENVTDLVLLDQTPPPTDPLDDIDGPLFFEECGDLVRIPEEELDDIDDNFLSLINDDEFTIQEFDQYLPNVE